MSYSDFDRIYTTYISSGTTASLTGGTDGIAVLNSSLSSPLLTSGDYCRSYSYLVSATSSSSYYFQEQKTVANDPSYIDIPHNYAISLRAKVRHGSGTLTNLYSTSINYRAYDFVGLAAYTDTGTDGQLASNTTIGWASGFRLILQRYYQSGTTSTVGVRLALYVGQGRHSTNASGAGANEPNNNLEFVCSGTYTTNQWYHIRLDVIPLSLSSKRLVTYTSSDDGATWDNVGEVDILESDTSRWRNSGRVGFISGRYRYDFDDGATDRIHNATFYIDNFKIYKDQVI